MLNAELQSERITAVMSKKYNAIVHRLIDEGKLTGYYYTDTTPALALVFDALKHPLMHIREHKWNEYKPLLAAIKGDCNCYDGR